MTPAYQFAIGDQIIDFAGRVVAISLSMETPDRYVSETSDTLEITLDNMGPAKLALPPRGRVITVSLGYAEIGLVKMGTYIVDETELQGPPDVLIIRAQSNPKNPQDTPYASIMDRKNAYYPGPITIGALVANIAAANNLQSAVATSLAGIVLPQVNQLNVTDFDLLGQIGRINNAYPKIQEGKLIFTPIGTAKSVSGAQMQGVTVTRITDPAQQPDPAKVYAGRYSAKFTDWIRFETCIATYWDMAAAKEVEVQVGSGAQPTLRLSNRYPNEDVARRAATSARLACDRRAGEVSVEVPGLPTAVAEGTLTLTNFAPDVDDDWCIRKVSHRITKEGGFVTDIEANRLSADAISAAASNTA